MTHQIPVDPPPVPTHKHSSHSLHRLNEFGSREKSNRRNFGNERHENIPFYSSKGDMHDGHLKSGARQQASTSVAHSSSSSISSETHFHDQSYYHKHSYKSSSGSDGFLPPDNGHQRREPQRRQAKPLPLIHFPPDHPYYQGVPLNPGSNLESQNRSHFNNICSMCRRPLSTSKTVLKALGNKYHPECFQCSHCALSLEHAAFFPHEGKVYCHLDYHELFSPRCNHCNTPIEGEVVNAMGKAYHVGHFFCAGCSEVSGKSILV